MGLPKHKRMTGELILRMMEPASIMTYRGWASPFRTPPFSEHTV